MRLLVLYNFITAPCDVPLACFICWYSLSCSDFCTLALYLVLQNVNLSVKILQRATLLLASFLLVMPQKIIVDYLLCVMAQRT